MPDSVQARARRLTEAKARVEQAALDLFHAHGFNAVTVEQISDAAGIGPATFYRYFGTKYGVLFAYQPLLLAGIRDAVEKSPAELTRSAFLLTVLTTFSTTIETHSRAMSLRDDIVASDDDLLARTLAVQRAWETQLADSLARRRGLPTADLAAWIEAALGLSVIRVAFRHWRAGHAPSMSEAVEAVFAEAAQTLASPSGRSADTGL